MIDQAPLWLPPKPAIRRSAEFALLRPGAFTPVTREERRAIVADMVRSRRLTVAEAQSAMFFVPVLARPWAQPVVLTYLGNISDPTNLATYNFGNFTAPSDGLMIVGAVGNAGTAYQVSSIKIGGTNGTLHTTGTYKGSTGIASRAITAGSVAVSVTFSATGNRGACFVWLLTRYRSATPTASVSNGNDSNGTSIGATLSTIAAGGVALYVHNHNATGATTWSAATSRDDLTVESTTRMSAADKSTSVDLASDTETGSFASTSAAISAASWR